MNNNHKLNCRLCNTEANFVFNNKIADKIIIGIKNIKEFEEIIKCVERKSKKYPKN